LYRLFFTTRFLRLKSSFETHNLSKLVNSSLSMLSTLKGVTVPEYYVNPAMSANNIVVLSNFKVSS